MESLLLKLLFDVSQGLMQPIVIGMSLVSIWLVFRFGQLIRTAMERRIYGGEWRSYIDQVCKKQAPVNQWPMRAQYSLHRWIAKRSMIFTDLPILMKEAEAKAHSKLGQLQILIRIGPMLGLVGTLIPLGPALQGLSEGDLKDMGSHMHIAFTMTIFGILIGAMSYAMYILQRNWFENDLAELDLLHSMNKSGDFSLTKSESHGELSDEPRSASLAS